MKGMFKICLAKLRGAFFNVKDIFHTELKIYDKICCLVGTEKIYMVILTLFILVPHVSE